MALQEQIQKANILIVDDNPVNVQLLEEILEQENYTNIYSTTDPRQVKALDQQWHFDIILLDIRMPHMDGFKVMEELADAGMVLDEDDADILHSILENLKSKLK